MSDATTNSSPPSFPRSRVGMQTQGDAGTNDTGMDSHAGAWEPEKGAGV